MTKTRKTHNGKKTATTIINENFVVYLSQANTKSLPTFLTLGAVNPDTGAFNKIRLDGRQVSTLRKLLA